MPSSGLATTSNLTLVLAIATYAVAMLAYAFDFMFGRRRAAGAVPGAAVASADGADRAGATAGADLSGLSFPADPSDLSQLADVADRQPGAANWQAGSAAVGGSAAGGGTAAALLTVAAPGVAARAPGTSSSGHPPASPAPSGAAASWPGARDPRWPAGGWLRGAFALTCAGSVLQVIAILTRGLAEHRVPWGNMYEFIAAITCAAVLALIAAAVRFRAHYMGLFVLLPVVLALAVDVVVVYTPAGQLVPALQSYWIAIHVTAMIVAIGMFIFGAVVTVMYLLAARHERILAQGATSGAAGILSQLPGSAMLDRLSYRAILFAFPAWTFAVIAGAIWADHAWGRYWGWDPKETWSFITWLVYAAYLHARATAGWRGRRAAYIQLFGFTCLMFNLVGINLWVSGLHSYAHM